MQRKWRWSGSGSTRSTASNTTTPSLSLTRLHLPTGLGGKFLGLVGYLMTLLQLETNLLQIEKLFILVKCLLWQLYIRNMKWYNTISRVLLLSFLSKCSDRSMIVKLWTERQINRPTKGSFTSNNRIIMELLVHFHKSISMADLYLVVCTKSVTGWSTNCRRQGSI